MTNEHSFAAQQGVWNYLQANAYSRSRSQGLCADAQAAPRRHLRSPSAAKRASTPGLMQAHRRTARLASLGSRAAGTHCHAPWVESQ